MGDLTQEFLSLLHGAQQHKADAIKKWEAGDLYGAEDAIFKALGYMEKAKTAIRRRQLMGEPPLEGAGHE
jgi:hypothetical protein